MMFYNIALFLKFFTKILSETTPHHLLLFFCSVSGTLTVILRTQNEITINILRILQDEYWEYWSYDQQKIIKKKKNQRIIFSEWSRISKKNRLRLIFFLFEIDIYFDTIILFNLRHYLFQKKNIYTKLSP